MRKVIFVFAVLAIGLGACTKPSSEIEPEIKDRITEKSWYNDISIFQTKRIKFKDDGSFEYVVSGNSGGFFLIYRGIYKVTGEKTATLTKNFTQVMDNFSESDFDNIDDISYAEIVTGDDLKINSPILNVVRNFNKTSTEYFGY